MAWGRRCRAWMGPRAWKRRLRARRFVCVAVAVELGLAAINVCLQSVAEVDGVR